MRRFAFAGVPAGTPSGGPPMGDGDPPVGNGVAALFGTNTENDVRPSGFSTGQWQYSLFTSYGGGALVPGWGSKGCYAISGSGGHGAPENTGAAIFDFADYTWKYLANTNGVAAQSSPFVLADTTGSPYYEITGSVVPSPGHCYRIAYGVGIDVFHPITAFATSDGGGGGAGSTHMHRCRLNYATQDCTWTRVGTNDTRAYASSGGFSAGAEYVATFYEAARDRLLHMNAQTHMLADIPYCDPDVGTWGAISLSAVTPDPAAEVGQLIHDDTGQRLWYAGQNGRLYRANIGASSITGWTDVASHSLANSLGATRWHEYPSADGGDGNFYAYAVSNRGTNTLQRFNPSTMTFDTVSVTGATLSSWDNATDGGSNHYSRFFYVPGRKCFSWIAGNAQQVALLRPPVS